MVCQGREELGRLAKRVVSGVWCLVSDGTSLARVHEITGRNVESWEERDRGV